jgi:hypothetical protein
MREEATANGEATRKGSARGRRRPDVIHGTGEEAEITSNRGSCYGPVGRGQS